MRMENSMTAQRFREAADRSELAEAMSTDFAARWRFLEFEG
jgi:hypothetical protein